jgi:hypothetical protein
MSMLKPPETIVGHEGSAMIINLCNITPNPFAREIENN